MFLFSLLEVFEKADKSRNAVGIDTRLVSSCPNALFSNFKLTTNCDNYLKDVSNTQIVSLMYKLITNAKGSDGLFIGFNRDRDRRRELTNIKSIDGK